MMMRKLSSAALLATLASAAPYTGVPFGGAAQLPGAVQAAYFDEGTAGVTYYHVNSPGDAGMPTNAIRAELPVQINDVSGSEPAGSLAVGMIVSKEWLRYSVNVPLGGTFVPSWRVAAFNPSGAAVPVATKIVVDGESADPCALPGAGGLDLSTNTGGWKTFATFSADAMPLQAGPQVLTVCFDKVAGFELQSIAFAQQTVTEVEAAPTAAPTVEPTVAPTVEPAVTTPVAAPLEKLEADAAEPASTSAAPSHTAVAFSFTSAIIAAVIAGLAA